MSRFRPRLSNEIFADLLALARQYQVPVLIHVDSANATRLIELCQEYDDLSLIFAHAGGNLKPQHIRQVINRCDNVTIELSARDPWRYGGLTDDETHNLLPGWRSLILEHPGRFIMGTDPVWRVTRTRVGPAENKARLRVAVRA